MEWHEPLVNHVLYALLTVLVCAAAVFDLKSKRIPNALTFPAMLVFVAVRGAFGGLEGLVASLVGLAAGLTVLLAPYAMKLMGAGDVKLMAAIGACLGPAPLLTVFLFTSVAGGAHFLLHLLAVRLRSSKAARKSPDGPKKHSPRLCYGLALALGTLATLAWHFSGRAYLSLL